MINKKLSNLTHKPDLYTLYINFIKFLSRKRKSQLKLLILLMIFNSVAEIISLASVIPFLLIINNPDKLSEYTIINKILPILNLQQTSDLILPITIIFMISAIFAGSIRLLNLWYSGIVSVGIGLDISSQIFRRVMDQEYEFHLQKNSSEILTTLTSHISQTIAVIRTILNVITSFFISCAVIASLFFLNWKIALFSIFIFCAAYISLAYYLRIRLIFNSKIVADSCEKQIRTLQDSLGSIRDIILDSNQKTYSKIFEKIDSAFRFKANQNQFIGAFPKYIFETLGLCIVSFLAFILVIEKDSGIFIIPILGVFAFGAQKLLPALQQVYTGWSTINASLMELNIVMEMMHLPTKKKYFPSKKVHFKQLQFENVTFKYSQNDSNTLNGINLIINSGEVIGIVGTNGSGKSTTVDLLMGLLKPSNGRILVNGKDIHRGKYLEDLTNWRNLISHVPQNVFISNSTISDNIAFGVPKEFVNKEKLFEAAKKAHALEFINKSPLGFESKVGERGSNLSGGQLQRIGIARALYKDSPILILDEATSALDRKIESKVLKSVIDSNEFRTIIIISHKSSTLKNCDRFIKLSGGSIIENVKKE